MGYDINLDTINITNREYDEQKSKGKYELINRGSIAGLWSDNSRRGYEDAICWVPPAQLLESEIKKNNALVKESEAKISLYHVMEKYFDSITDTKKVKENVDDVPKPKTNKGANNSSRAADATRLANMIL